MRPISVCGVAVRLEAAEAGGRYAAPILIVPGLFQSWVCWRGVTSMLAHRGWDVYLVARADDDGTSIRPNCAVGWSAAVAAATSVASGLASKVIVFGADVGASMALAAGTHVRPLALALFAPVAPAAAGAAYHNSLGFFEKRRRRAGTDLVSAPAAVAKQVHRETDAALEPAGFIEDLVAGPAFERAAEHAPAIVFTPQDDPFVERSDSLAFAACAYAKTAKTPLQGRWWPSSNWEPIVDEVHRFLILTLADRVVEFPEEILES